MLGRAHYRHGMRVPLEEHVLVMAPPRTGKTGWLARSSCITRARCCRPRPGRRLQGLTSGIRARDGRPSRCSTRQHRRRAQHVPLVSDRWLQGPGGRYPPRGWVRLRDQPGGREPSCQERGPRLSAGAVPRGRPGRRGYTPGVAVGADRRAGAAPARPRRSCGDHGSPGLGRGASQLRGAAEKTAATNGIVMCQMLGFMMDPGARRGGPARAGDDLDLADFLRAAGRCT